VVRTPVDEGLRPIGRSTKGVGFVRLKKGDAVAVVARSVEAKVTEEAGEEAAEDGAEGEPAVSGADAVESPDAGAGATIEGSQTDDGPDDAGSQED
jgi:DNA gyrase subunit A